jgi:hypothetical protein
MDIKTMFQVEVLHHTTQEIPTFPPKKTRIALSKDLVTIRP